MHQGVAEMSNGSGYVMIIQMYRLVYWHQTKQDYSLNEGKFLRSSFEEMGKVQGGIDRQLEMCLEVKETERM